MTVTPEQWAAAAEDHGMTVEKLRELIALIDAQGDLVPTYPELPPLHFDRDLDPLTLGEWSMLFGAPSYKYIAAADLPNGRWVATVWHGLNEDMDDPPIVMDSAVFAYRRKGEPLSSPLHLEAHATLGDALEAHERLLKEWA